MRSEDFPQGTQIINGVAILPDRRELHYDRVRREWLPLKPEKRINQTNQNNHNKGLINPINYVPPEAKMPEQSLKVISAVEIMNQETEQVSYLWGTFLPDKSIVLLSGEAGVGKTTLAYNLAIKAAKGKELVGIPFARPVNVLYCDLETGQALRKSKLELISEEDIPNNLYFAPTADFLKQFNELKAEIEEKRIELLIVDTINEAFQTKDESDNAEANTQFKYIKALRDEAGCTILLMHHIGKGQPGKKVYSARGASARAAAVDVVLNLLALTEDTVCLEKVKDRIAGGIEKLYLRKAGEGNFEVIEKGEDSESPALIRAQNFIMTSIEQGVSHRFELNEQGRQGGFSEATVGRALERLVAVAKIKRLKKGFFGLPSPNPPPSLEEGLRLIGLEINQSAQTPNKINLSNVINPPKP